MVKRDGQISCHTSYDEVSSESLAARTEATCASISRRSLSLTLEESQFASSTTASASLVFLPNRATKRSWKFCLSPRLQSHKRKLKFFLFPCSLFCMNSSSCVSQKKAEILLISPSTKPRQEAGNFTYLLDYRIIKEI